MNFISREEAAASIRKHWLDEFSRERLLATHEPDWSRLRNYEIEQMLEATFSGEWCVAEWCPFNGVHCRWMDHAPQAATDEVGEDT